MCKNLRLISIVLIIAMSCFGLIGCSTEVSEEITQTEEVVRSETPNPNEGDAANVEVTGGAPEMSLTAVSISDGITDYEIPGITAPGIQTKENEKAIIDYSNVPDGYFAVKYLGDNQKVKVLVTGPSGAVYQYLASLDKTYNFFPFSDGNGGYKIAVYENISGDKYSTASSLSLDVQLTDEFAPFLRPNKYVDFNESSSVTKKAQELCEGTTTTTEKIKAVYGYTINNITYDYDLASTVKFGYIPDLDAVMVSKKGICFDYAALMTAMLRSHGVPTKLVFGYTGSLYHAWISTYSEESGWIEAAIYFDGETWKLMDPTFASNDNSSESIMQYINNEKNYQAKYLY